MTRQEKTNDLINTCISKMNDEDGLIYRPILEYAALLGYTPKPIKKAGGNADELTFSKSKVNRTLLRINPCIEKPYGQVREIGKAQLRLVFFATPNYSEPFYLGVKNMIDLLGGNYNGCGKCGKCNGDEGYTFIYPDGKKVILFGCQLLELPPIGAEHIEEVKVMIKAQDDFWMNKIEKRRTPND